MENLLNTMTPEVEAEFRAGIRRFLTERGTPVRYAESWSDERLDMRENMSHTPGRETPRWMTDYGVSTYGWSDRDAHDHCRPVDKYNRKGGCSWEIPEGTQVTEVSLSQFNGTGCGNTYDEGLHAFPVNCACGKYTDVVLRWEGSISDILMTLFGYNPKVITL